jgi:HlyD family secretion protein
MERVDMEIVALQRVGVVGLLVCAVLGLTGCNGGESAGQAFRTAKIDRGNVEVSISATGTLRALSTVDVGSQVSGQVLSVEVDFNEAVTRGQVIARIDPGNFETRLTQAEADLASAEAGLVEAQTALRLAEAELKRKNDLAGRKLISASELDVAQAGRDQAASRVGSARAAVKQRAAGVADARLDLTYTEIRSPVDGVILLRSVEPGQTVAASFQTPVLFRIAEDLTRMQIDLSIDESDVGQIREGMAVQFNVDAFPNRQFEGRVHQVRLAATNVANVVTYPVVVEVSNADGVLLPGMTANAEITVASRRDTLRVPNAALRFKPEGVEAPPASGFGGGGNGEELQRIAASLALRPEQQAAFDQVVSAMRERAEARRRQMAGGGGGGAPGAGGGGGGSGAAPSAEQIAAMRARFQQMFRQALAPFRDTLDEAQRQRFDQELDLLESARRVNLWQLKDGKPEAVAVRVGVSDATHSEIIGGGVEEGAEVIVGGGA